MSTWQLLHKSGKCLYKWNIDPSLELMIMGMNCIQFPPWQTLYYINVIADFRKVRLLPYFKLWLLKIFCRYVIANLSKSKLKFLINGKGTIPLTYYMLKYNHNFHCTAHVSLWLVGDLISIDDCALYTNLAPPYQDP